MGQPPLKTLIWDLQLHFICSTSTSVLLEEFSVFTLRPSAVKNSSNLAAVILSLSQKYTGRSVILTVVAPFHFL